jgi:hypothetical protein
VFNILPLACSGKEFFFYRLSVKAPNVLAMKGESLRDSHTQEEINPKPIATSDRR